MDSMFTQSRRTPRNLGVRYSVSQRGFPGGPWTVVERPDSYGAYAPTQTTTSHRTGRTARQLTAPTSLEDIVDAATSQESLFSALKEQKRDQDYPGGVDRGHEFSTETQTLYCSHSSVDLYNAVNGPGTGTLRYQGPLVWVPPTSVLGLNYFDSVPAVNTGFYGPKAVSQTRPSQSQADLAVGLAEVWREGFPAGLQQNVEDFSDRASVARLAGSKHLETQFGWLPLLADIQKTYHATRRARELLEQYERDAGKAIRRKMTFPTTVSEESAQTTGDMSIIPLGNVLTNSMIVGGTGSGFPVTESVRRQQSVSFSGAYSYHLSASNPIFVEKLKRAEQEFNYLYGVRITPEVLWNLAPWSWLSDWKMNLGDNIANDVHLGSDGLVMRYGYLMCETIVDHTYTLFGPVFKNGTTGPYSLQFTTVRKQRVRATPFGFGLNPSSFSLKQWSILGALGITKGPTSLW